MNKKRDNNHMGSVGTTDRDRRAAAALSVAFRQSKNKGENQNRGSKTAGCEEGNQLAALWLRRGFFLLCAVWCDVCRKETEHRVIL